MQSKQYQQVESRLLEGMLGTLFPLPLLCAFDTSVIWLPTNIRFYIGIFSGLFFLLSAHTLAVFPSRGKFYAFTALAFSTLTWLPGLLDKPTISLLYLILAYIFGSVVIHFQPIRKRILVYAPSAPLRQRFAGSMLVLLGLFAYYLFYEAQNSLADRLVTAVATLVFLVYQLAYVHRAGSKLKCFAFYLWDAILLLVMGCSMYYAWSPLISFLVILPSLPAFSAFLVSPASESDTLLDIIAANPERILPTTFLILCLSGTILLSLPFSTVHKISVIDAAFTAVSAVCVTGLVTLDTARDFTPIGQFFLMLLIQLGGLGIMTITSTALFLLGRRMSLNQERLMSGILETYGTRTLESSLRLICKFTFFTELTGAILLTFFFLCSGLSLPSAVWNGVFTAVSGFCNAGFALHSTNLCEFNGNPGILYTVGGLIILGGIAPATAIMIPAWATRKVNPVCKIILTTTLLLPVSTP